MAVLITSDERAAMRERYTANLPPGHNPAGRTVALRRLGHASRDDVPRLLDALEAAEAEAELYRVWRSTKVSPLWYEKVSG